MQTKIILLLFIIPFILKSQDTDFQWLVGKWKVDSDKSKKYEVWQMDGNRLKGEGYSVKEGQKNVFETLFLEDFGGQWAYIALPDKQQITLFALVHSENNRYVFENKEHDFPQRIIYNYDDSKHIHVSVEADHNGKTKKFELNLSKIE
jgi:hypothetical protein